MRGMLQPNTSFLHTFNLPIIRPLCNIAHLFECVAMFYFIKRLSVFRITTQPLTNRFLYFCLLLSGKLPNGTRKFPEAL